MERKDEEKEAEAFIDGLNNYVVIDNPPQNGFQMDDYAAIMDILYSAPDEARNDTYSHLRDGEKMTVLPKNGDSYSQLNHSQVATNTKRSPAVQENPANEDVMYAMPDKKKKKKKQNRTNAPDIPDKSSELVEYLDAKETFSLSHSQRPNGDECDIPE